MKSNNKATELPVFSYYADSFENIDQWICSLEKYSPLDIGKHLIAASNDIQNYSLNAEQVELLHKKINAPIVKQIASLSRQAKLAASPAYVYKQQIDLFVSLGELYTHLLNQNGIANHAKLRLNLMNHATSYLSECIILSFQLYRAAPKNCWYNLHQIFSGYYQELNDGSSKIQKFLTRSNQKKAQLDEMFSHYHATVILSCVSPEQLNPKNIRLLFEYFQINHFKLNFTNIPSSEHAYIIKTHVDSAPIENKGDNSIETYNLFFSLSAFTSTSDEVQLSKQLHEHIAKFFQSKPSRRFNRKAEEGQLNISSGMQSAHYFLCGKRSFTEFSSRFNGMFVESATSMSELKKKNRGTEQQDEWQNIYSANWDSFEITSPELIQSVSPAQNSDDKAAKPTSAFDIINTNATGFCLTKEKTDQEIFIPGDLITLLHDRNTACTVGVVRRVRNNKDRIEIGVELLGPKPSAFGIKINRGSIDTDYLPAIITGHIATSRNSALEDQTHEILIPNLSITGKTSAVLISEEHEEKIMLTECIESGTNFQRYLFKTQTNDKT